MARYPNAGQVLWVAPVKDKVKKAEIKESRHWTRPYGRIETHKAIFVKKNLVVVAIPQSRVEDKIRSDWEGLSEKPWSGTLTR